ncbi:MAG: hypothetical protein IJH00_00985 [Erysipelotrichaceae bacterium]|nr:hypothetical protein [Erysipelotrichaceae bacterium]
MKKTLTVLLAIIMVLFMSACSVETSSSSTSTFTTTTTDSDGKTTQTTTTTENGVTTTETITTSADDPTGLRNKWREYFTKGAEGVSNNGENIYMIMDDPSAISLAAIMITSKNNEELLTYVYGELSEEDGIVYINDVEEDMRLPFQLGDSNFENCFEIYFQDGDAAVMELVDLDKIIDDMISIWEVHQQAYQEAHSN